jgi:hypothetical protein
VTEASSERVVVDLTELPPAAVFFRLLSQRFTGVLHLEQSTPAAGRRRVLFRGGMPVWTDYVQEGSLLGELAVTGGLASRAAVDAAVARVANDRKLGELLVEDGVITPAGLSTLLRNQCARRLLEVLVLERGIVELEATSDGDPSALQVNVLELIQRAVSARYDTARVRRELGPAAGAKFRITSAFERYVDQFKFKPDDGSVLGFLASGAPSGLADLAKMPDASERRAAQILAVLWHCRMIEALPEATGRDLFERELAELEGRFGERKDPIAIIGVDSDATLPEIDAAWHDLAARFDPRALGDEDADLRGRVQEVADALVDVRESARNRRRVLAEATGLRLVSEGKYARGLALLEEVTVGQDVSPEVANAILWANLQLGTRTSSELAAAEIALRRTLAVHPDEAAGHYYLGCVLAWMSRKSDAIAALERALELDPRLVDAQRQLRSLTAADRAAEPAGQRKPAARAPEPAMLGRIASAPRHPLLSAGYVRLYWIAGVLLVLLIAANVVLRADVDY